MRFLESRNAIKNSLFRVADGFSTTFVAVCSYEPWHSVQTTSPRKVIDADSERTQTSVPRNAVCRYAKPVFRAMAPSDFIKILKFVGIALAIPLNWWLGKINKELVEGNHRERQKLDLEQGD
ncbi:hypothetical protein H6G33_38290 [Calothrix sp. FACHB-1219]|uniref:hypothetical protein n=1 Tax=Calothrix sp. FACHB-1219 TaxID=2692778 RepID=UPI001686BC09|nr:hypothetical protein [Calothrix sp. FACHB-1219]MBD2222767.1 hypothetical protein [Calothrix sp. FACHB-1219]